MPSYVTPKKNVAYVFFVSLVSQADTKLMKSSPTLAAGDFKVSIDGGTLNNLTTLPTVTPAASVMVKISLSTSEMNGDNITVTCIDAAGAEWCDLVVNLQTSSRQIDDLAYVGEMIAELPQAQPDATPSWEEAIMFLYMALRNARTDTAAGSNISNDAGTVIAKAALSDNGSTFTKDKFVSGP